jgi:hypothetical protein
MAHVVGEEGRVTAIEFDRELAARAKSCLAELRCVEVVSGDASIYDTGEADVIFINAGATHPLPLWLDNLKPGGRLLFPLTHELGSMAPLRFGVMMRVRRLTIGYEADAISPVGIFPCFGAIDAEADRLMEKLLGKVVSLASGPFVVTHMWQMKPARFMAEDTASPRAAPRRCYQQDAPRMSGHSAFPRFVEGCVVTGVPADFYSGVTLAGPLATFDAATTGSTTPIERGLR